eukprot:m.208539 g.208539  ORF g.208539 m.208539 type:complete len:313 (+) comp10132_c1_seq1:410-1348(+)
MKPTYRSTVLQTVCVCPDVCPYCRPEYVSLASRSSQYSIKTCKPRVFNARSAWVHSCIGISVALDVREIVLIAFRVFRVCKASRTGTDELSEVEVDDGRAGVAVAKHKVHTADVAVADLLVMKLDQLIRDSDQLLDVRCNVGALEVAVLHDKAQAAQIMHLRVGKPSDVAKELDVRHARGVRLIKLVDETLVHQHVAGVVVRQRRVLPAQVLAVIHQHLNRPGQISPWISVALAKEDLANQRFGWVRLAARAGRPGRAAQAHRALRLQARPHVAHPVQRPRTGSLSSSHCMYSTMLQGLLCSFTRACMLLAA